MRGNYLESQIKGHSKETEQKTNLSANNYGIGPILSNTTSTLLEDPFRQKRPFC
jgi:hypothetical protein